MTARKREVNSSYLQLVENNYVLDRFLVAAADVKIYIQIAWDEIVSIL